ncbi:hypothetical protein HYT92_01075 [Candidatus Pacearchaeota archaeon]|nr:hypothetical protein [Candidatus Pacearchaeota archaeon]
MNKALGYVISVAGIVLIALSTAFTRLISKISFLEGIKSVYILAAGIVLVVIGIFFVLSSDSASKQPREVPIYEGEGKKRKVVGYKRMGK